MAKPKAAKAPAKTPAKGAAKAAPTQAAKPKGAAKKAARPAAKRAAKPAEAKAPPAETAPEATVELQEDLVVAAVEETAPLAQQGNGSKDVPIVTLETPDEMPAVTLASEEELEEKEAWGGQSGEEAVGEDAEEDAEERYIPPPGPATQLPLNTEWSLPEQFLTVALHDNWDDRMEKAKAGRQGAAMVASLLFELAVRGRLRLHLDRFQVTGEPTGDPALDEFATVLDERSDLKTADALEKLGNKAGRHIEHWRGRLHRRGVAREQKWRFLGVFPRSRTLVTDAEAKAKLENRLQRTLVGGTPDVRTILLLGLIDAAGLLPEIIPEGALAFNRKRIHALLTGRDTLGYRVDPAIHDLQGALVSQILQDVRVLQGVRD